MDSLFLVLFLGFVAYFMYSVFTKSGKGRMFGGKITQTLDSTITKERGINKTTIRIHLIEKPQGERCIGLELTDNAKLAWSLHPVTFSKAEAQQLVVMLNEAISRT